MPKIDISRTELVWPGKYDDDGNLVTPRRVNLPFQVIERVNETRATREKKEEELAGHVGTLFDYWQASKTQAADPGNGWRNKLIWGDNAYVMGSLLEHFAGQIDLIYIDPPFATGADFSFRASIGDEQIAKGASLIEEKAYRDTWGRGLDSFLQMLFDRFQFMRDLLSDYGTIYIHMGWQVSHFVKAVLDEVFGPAQFLNQIIWKRQTAHSDIGQGSKHLGPIHDVIFLYTKSDAYTWNMQYQPYSEEYINSFYKHIEPETGRRYRLSDITGPGGAAKGNPFYEFLGVQRYWRFKRERMEELYRQGRIVQTNPGTVPAQKRYLDEMPGVPLQDLWLGINSVQPQAKERLGYDTQKPEILLERIINQSSNPGDIVADFFCGSGTTVAVAEKLSRRWIGCDLSRYAIHTTRKRLMDIPNCRPFEVLNLGKYERQVWQGVTFGGQKQTQDMLVFEYLKFILDLYGAQPLPGTQHLHGKKGRAVVHVGTVDAPVTIDEILACLEECELMSQKELHVLGWEWEMGLANLMVDEAKGRGIRLLMLHIPREVMEQQAVDKGDIQFYELAYLETAIEVKDRTATVKLTDFVIPNDELIPPDVRSKIKKWSDYVDYWAVDWHFQNDTFVNGWTSYRTRQDRSLKLETEAYEYEAPGAYRLLVKVIDIFGNDTSQLFEVSVT
jgi:DNA modification methylase